MENTIENKAKFYGNYAGQMILMAECMSSPIYVRITDATGYTDTYLELKPLSSITDEDAIEVAKLCSFCDGEGYIVYSDAEDKVSVFDKYEDYPDQRNVFHIYHIHFEIFSLDDEGKVFEYDWYRLMEVTDHLRSKGYALPFMGLSVEQQIEYGWVKLTNPASNAG